MIHVFGRRVGVRVDGDRGPLGGEKGRGEGKKNERDANDSLHRARVALSGGPPSPAAGRGGPRPCTGLRSRQLFGGASLISSTALPILSVWERSVAISPKEMIPTISSRLFTTGTRRTCALLISCSASLTDASSRTERTSLLIASFTLAFEGSFPSATRRTTMSRS